MKAIFKVPLFVLPALMFTQCEWFGEDEQNYNDSVNIPDAAFLSAIIANGVDINGDSLISYQEAEAADGLAIWGAGDILDVTGLEAFINLKGLFYDGVGFSEICLSENVKLESLEIRTRPNCCLPVSGEGNLETIDISGNQMLTTLICNNQRISKLDLSNNVFLTDIRIRNNPNLTQICVWTTPFPAEGVEVDKTYSPNVYFITECSK